MCDMCTPNHPTYASEPGTPERLAEVNAKRHDDILRVGHQVACIYADGNDRPGFFYTIGRSLFGKPELLLTGNLPPRTGQSILNSLAKLENEGGVDLRKLAESEGPVQVEGFESELRFIYCDPEAGEMFQAMNLHSDGLITGIQVIWPDAEGRWPEDADFAYGPGVQPLYPLA